MLSAVMLSAVMLSPVMLSAVMLNVIMLNVVEPLFVAVADLTKSHFSFIFFSTKPPKAMP